MAKHLPASVRGWASRHRPYLIALLAVVGLAVLLASASLGTVRVSGERADAERWRVHTLEVLVDAKALSAAVRDMQRGQRGFLLTADPTYLEPYDQGVRTSAALLATLRDETADNPTQQANLADVAAGLDALSGELARTLDLARSGQQNEALALVRTGEGRRHMQRLSTALDRIVAEENRLLALRSAAADAADARVGRRTLYLTLLGAGLLAAGILLGALALRRHVQRAEIDALMRTVLRSIDGAVFAKDTAGRYTLMSEVGSRLFGRPVRDILGRTDEELRPPLFAAVVVDHDVQVRAQGGPLSFDEAVEVEGRTLLLRTTRTPLHTPGGTATGVAGVALDVTAHRKIEAALIQAEAEARAVFDLVAVGIAQAHPATRQFVRANRKLVEITGYSTTELLEITLDQLVHPDDRKAAAEGFGRFSETGAESFHIETRLRRKDGAINRVRIDVTLARAPDGTPLRMVAIVEDIGSLQRVERDLARTGALLRAIVEATPGLIFAKDRQGRMTLANDPALALIGKPWVDVEGRTDAEFLTNTAQGKAIMANDRRIMEAGGTEVLEEPVSLPDGTPCLWLSTKAPLRDPDGVVTGLVGVSVDITARKAAEAELRSFNETLATRVREAVEAREAALAQLYEAQKMETIGQLTGGVAHDFNNLLAAILSNLDLVQKRVTDPRVVPLLDGAIKSAERGAVLTKRLLAFARRQDLQTETVAVPALFEGMRDLLARSLGPEVRVTADLPMDLPLVHVDPNQLELALLNIALNARDAMPDGGILTVTACAARFEEPSAEDQPAAGSYVRIGMTDSGHGMDAATLKRATEPFFTTKGIGKGTGLGLSMVQGLAAQLGGAMRIASAPGQGTTIELYLPQAAFGQAVASSPPVLIDPLPARRQWTILVVDDDILVAMGTVAMLEDLGHAVFEANSGYVALGVLAQHPEINLVLTDYAMPGMTGLELARHIHKTTPALPVVLASGYADLPGKGGDTGLPRLPKPFRQEELYELLNRLGVEATKDTGAIAPVQR